MDKVREIIKDIIRDNNEGMFLDIESMSNDDLLFLIKVYTSFNRAGMYRAVGNEPYKIFFKSFVCVAEGNDENTLNYFIREYESSLNKGNLFRNKIIFFINLYKGIINYSYKGDLIEKVDAIYLVSIMYSIFNRNYILSRVFDRKNVKELIGYDFIYDHFLDILSKNIKKIGNDKINAYIKKIPNPKSKNKKYKNNNIDRIFSTIISDFNDKVKNKDSITEVKPEALNKENKEKMNKKMSIVDDFDKKYPKLESIKKSLLASNRSSVFINDKSVKNSRKNCLNFIDENINFIFKEMYAGREMFLSPVPYISMEFFLKNIKENFIYNEIQKRDNIENYELDNEEDKIKLYEKIKDYIDEVYVANLNGIKIDKFLSSDRDIVVESHKDNLIQVDVYEREMGAIIGKIKKENKTLVSEYGIHSSYIVFGFLRWFDKFKKENYSPLVMVPVNINVKSSRGVKYTVNHNGQDLLFNKVLEVKLKEYEDFVLEEFIEEDYLKDGVINIEDYFNNIEKSIPKSRTGWEVIRCSFLKNYNPKDIIIYNDLKFENWKNVDYILDKPLVQKVINQDYKYSRSTAHKKIIAEDIETLERDYPTVLDADSTQYDAVVSAVSGHSFVIEGPPGTGKSQTIVNIIASLLGQNKKILFVSEKAAALDVVMGRMNEVGLGELCLDLHGDRLNKKSVINSINNRYKNYKKNKKSNKQIEFDGEAKELMLFKNELNSYANTINSLHDKLNKTYHEIIGDIVLMVNKYPFIKDLSERLKCVGDNYLEYDEINDCSKNTMLMVENYREIKDITGNLGVDSLVWFREDLSGYFNSHKIGLIISFLKTVYTSLSDKINELGCLINDNIYLDKVDSISQLLFLFNNFKYINLFDSYSDLSEELDLILKILKKKEKIKFINFNNIGDDLDNIRALGSRLKSVDCIDASKSILENKMFLDDLLNIKDELFKYNNLIQNFYDFLNVDKSLNDEFEDHNFILLINFVKRLQSLEFNPNYLTCDNKDSFLNFEHKVLEINNSLKEIDSKRTILRKNLNFDINSVSPATLENVINFMKELEFDKKSLLSKYKMLGLSDVFSVLEKRSEWNEEVKVYKLGIDEVKKYEVLLRGYFKDIAFNLDNAYLNNMLKQLKDIKNKKEIIKSKKINNKVYSLIIKTNSKKLIRIISEIKDKIDKIKLEIKDLEYFIDFNIDNFKVSEYETYLNIIEANLKKNKVIKGFNRYVSGDYKKSIEKINKIYKNKDALDVDKVRHFKELFLLARKYKELLSNQNIKNIVGQDINLLNYNFDDLIDIVKYLEKINNIEENINKELSNYISADSLDLRFFKALISYNKKVSILNNLVDKSFVLKNIYKDKKYSFDDIDCCFNDCIKIMEKEKDLNSLVGELFINVDTSNEFKIRLLFDLVDLVKNYNSLKDDVLIRGFSVGLNFEDFLNRMGDLTINNSKVTSLIGEVEKNDKYKTLLDIDKIMFNNTDGLNGLKELSIEDFEVLYNKFKTVHTQKISNKIKDCEDALLILDDLGVVFDENEKIDLFLENIDNIISVMSFSSKLGCVSSLREVDVSSLKNIVNIVDDNDFIKNTFNSIMKAYKNDKEKISDLVDEIQNKIHKLDHKVSKDSLNDVGVVNNYKSVDMDEIISVVDDMEKSKKVYENYLKYKDCNDYFKTRIPLIVEYLDDISKMSEADLRLLVRTIYSYLEIDNIIKNNKVLSNFTRNDYGYNVGKFNDLLKNVEKLYKDIIIHKNNSRKITEGVKSNQSKLNTEMHLLERQFTFSKKFFPIRFILDRAWNAITDLKPCLMMSPSTVSQMLPKGNAEFDVLIIDEASQMYPESAIGAIARSKQIIIVGDSNQLPPVKHFTSDDGREDDLDSSESILELSKMILDYSIMLKWHYRSKHPSLINFSNTNFYEKSLKLFPPSFENNDMGIEYQYVENGYFEDGVNENEINALLSKFVEVVKRNPEKSYGIATMNSKNRDRISEKIEEIIVADSEFKHIYNEKEKTNDNIFVKNIENIQGDERDVIFISITYGKNKEKNRVEQRFGSINKKNGWRYLNVLFSRSREKMFIFSSINHLEITSESEGVQILKSFLKYAQNPNETKITISDKKPDSPFEEEVISKLESHGYKCIPQVGVSGFFIDIGVLDPSDESSFLMGIECDGASYHSSKSAKDRDVLRQKILEGYGWNIHRVWSTDWFKDSESEIKRIIDRLKILKLNRV